MKIGFYGAGKVAFSLGKYFKMKNIPLSGYYSQNYNSTIDASEFTSSNAYANLEDFIDESDFIFITTPDDIINEAWQRTKNYNIDGKIIAHASGSLSSHIFNEAKESGAFPLSIHPIFPFSDKHNCYKNLDKAFFTIEGDKTALNAAQSILKVCGNKTIQIDSDKKALYHLACVISSNLVLALTSIGAQYLRDIGFNESEAFSALYPLITSNIESINAKGFNRSLTGPIPRGDEITLRKHLSVIYDEHKSLYLDLCKQLLSLSIQAYPEKDYKNVIDILGGGN